MDYSGPLGVPRFTSLGPLVSQRSRTGQVGAVPIPKEDEEDDEFMGRCMDSEWAEEYAEGILESYDIPQTEEAKARIKEKACEGLLDNEVPEPEQTTTELDFGN